MAAAPRDAQSAAWAEEAAHWHWIGAVLLQVHLHDADVTVLPPPPPFLLSGPRIGYFPLLVSTIKAHFSSSLPPGVDTVWFEYKGLPLKWHIPIGVLYDLLCADPERPWNLTAAFIITGNSKNVMNMSQADQLAMWESVRKSEADNYMNISTKLKLGPFEEDFLVRASSLEPRQGSDEPECPGSVKPCRVPVRLYVRRVQEDLEYLEDAIPVSDWESVSYINRPFEIRKEGGRRIITLGNALETLLPEFFSAKPTARAAEPAATAPGSAPDDSDTAPGTPRDREAAWAIPREMVVAKKARVKLVRIQGMELGADTRFLWVANNLRSPECFLHVCVYVGA